MSPKRKLGETTEVMKEGQEVDKQLRGEAEWKIRGFKFLGESAYEEKFVILWNRIIFRCT